MPTKSTQEVVVNIHGVRAEVPQHLGVLVLVHNDLWQTDTVNVRQSHTPSREYISISLSVINLPLKKNQQLGIEKK